MSKPSFLAELKRRNVLRAATFYAASAWLVVQVATQVFPFFGIENWVVRWIVVAAAIGFPFAMLFSWFYEWTPQGIVRESEVRADESVTRETGKKLDRWIIAILSVAVVLLLANTFVLHKDATSRSGVVGSAVVAAIIDKSIAVLPLVNEGGNKDEQYFSDGLSEDLITALSQFDGLKVISRNSSFEFRDSKEDSRTIGAKLGVAHLLEGSVRRVGDEVRISAELVNAADGSTLWSEHYDRPYKDLFKLQDDITNAVAGELKARLLSTQGAVVQSDRPPSGNLDAYSAYLQGNYYFGRTTADDFRLAIAQYKKAIRIDPRYARAEAAFSRTNALLASIFLHGADAQEAYAQARAAANDALAIDPTLAMAHSARGGVLFMADFDWNGAEKEHRIALQLAPGDGLARFNLGQALAIRGQLGKAVALVQQALAIDPRDLSWNYWQSNFLLALGRTDEAEQVIRKAIEMQPTAVAAHEQLAAIEVLRGHAAAALQAAQQEPPGLWQDIALAIASQVDRDHAAADAALQHLVSGQGDGAAYQIAEVYALRNDPDRMFAWLDRAWAARDTGIHRLLFDPFIDRYRGDPRFVAFCRKVGLPTPAEVDAAVDAASNASGASSVEAASGNMP